MSERMEWYCLHTKPRKEAAAERYCRETLGIETYYPQLKRQKTIRRVKRWVTRPLFPRYFFCRLDLTKNYRGARYAPQVLDVVSFGEHPTVVDEAIIHQLKNWAGEAVDVLTLGPNYRPGDRVEITEGPLRGLEAIFQQELNDRDRVAILLLTLAHPTRAIVSRSVLNPIL
jgi:transcriptional antiterminator RfaH